MICSQCNKEFIQSRSSQKYCSRACSHNRWKQSEKGKEAIKKYRQSNEYKENLKKYLETDKYKKSLQSEKHKEVRKKYLQTDKAKALKRKYKQSDKGKAVENKYQRSDLGISTIKKYSQSDKFKNSQKKYMQTDKGIAGRTRHQKTDKYKNSKNKNARERRKTDPIYSLVNNVRARLGNFLRVRNMVKTNRTFKMVGCTPEFLKKHLEKQFYPHPTTNEKMTWKNHSKYGWHVDHKLPMDLAVTSEDVVELSHYTNLQPMWATENLKKGNKII
ncbi:hypothetical protein N8947_00620 [Candidatus Pelagibacter sp.]|nr:hypothetical protein [Candidatus Pelagibacter sp.]